MKLHLIAFSVSILLVFSAASWAAGHQSTSPRGPLFTVLPAPTSPFVSIRVVVHRGSMNDPAGKEGLAYLTAAVVANGGTRALTRAQVLEKFYPIYSSINAEVEKEMTVFHGTVHRDQLEKFYSLFSDLLFDPRFDPADFQRERDDAVNYLQNYLRGSDDEELGKEVLDQEVHRGHPYGHCTVGTVAGLKTLTLEDLRAFHKENLTGNSLEIGLGGSYSPEFLERVKSEFARLPKGSTSSPTLPQRRKLQGIEVTLIQKPTDAAAISIGFPVEFTRADKDFIPLMIANSCFGEHRTFIGRLQKDIRMVRGLNYGNYSYLEHFIEGESRFPKPNICRSQQTFSIWIRPVKPECTHFALRQALRDLEILVEKGLSDAEVADFKKFVTSNAPLWTQTLDRRLGYLIDSRFYGREDFVKDVIAAVPNITTSEVNSAIKRHLRSGNLQVVIVTDRAEKLKEALLEDMGSPISYEKKDIGETIKAEDKVIMTWPLKIDREKLRIVQGETLFEK